MENPRMAEVLKASERSQEEHAAIQLSLPRTLSLISNLEEALDLLHSFKLKCPADFRLILVFLLYFWQLKIEAERVMNTVSEFASVRQRKRRGGAVLGV